MADSFTPGLSLVKPEIGSSRDSWGSKTNTNWDTLDQFVSMAMPVGVIADYAGTQAPPGWLVCDGRRLSRVTYSQLFAAIGTTWGAGDGSTSFALPAVNGRALIGPGAFTDVNGTALSYTLGQSFGGASRIITLANLPGWNMVTDAQGYHSHGGATAPGGNHNHGTDVQGAHGHNISAVGDHTHYINDPGHAHGTPNYATSNTTSGGGPGGAVGNVYTFGSGTYGAGTGIWENGAGGHSHSTDVQGAHGHNITYSGNLQLGIYADGSHQHNVWSGGGGVPLTTNTPSLVVTKIIYAGMDAVTRATGASATAGTSALDREDELAAIREELAALRAILRPAGRRVLSTPLRGSH